MTSKECADAWKEIIQCYDATIEKNNPEITMKLIIERIGFEKAEEAFATIAAIKKSDGRIYGENRKYMDSVKVNPDSVKRDYANPMLSAGLDHIHTAHISNLITELRKLKKKGETEAC